MISQFASDNYESPHPEVARAIYESFLSTAELPYGHDSFSQKAKEAIKQLLNAPQAEVFFVSSGTAANVLGLSACMDSKHSVLASKVAHISEAECGAFEKFVGGKIFTLNTSQEGKISKASLEDFFSTFSIGRNNKPKVISLTQTTELGGVYSLEELKDIRDFAKSQGLSIHIDGARIANAAVYLKCTLSEILEASGADVLSLGMTKNGGLMAEAIVILNPEFSKDFYYTHKQGLQINSKMSFMAVQFLSLLKDNLWYQNALNANSQAFKIVNAIENLKNIHLACPFYTNQIFITFTKKSYEKIKEKYHLYPWHIAPNTLRIVTSSQSTHEQTQALIQTLQLLDNEPD